MSLRDRHKAQSRAAIHDAARALLASEGFEATTMRAIARRAGVSVGTVHNYVGSRAQLVVALFAADLQATIDRRAASLPAGPLLERVVHYFVGFFELYAAQPALSRTYVTESVFAPDAAFMLYADVTVAFIDRLAVEVRAAGELRPDVDPTLAARLCFDTYIGLVVLLLRQDQPDVAAATVALRARVSEVLDLMRPQIPNGPTSEPRAPGRA